MKNIDAHFIKKTLELAEKGIGKVSPNPLVGSIVVKDGEIAGDGFHGGPGSPHAETIALRKAGEQAKGATLYVNLEPCCHYGKTPPCTDSIIESGIKKVVASIRDPNPQVNGRGFEMLRENNINVVTQILPDEAKELNKFYLKFIQKKKPYVILKAALTLDGLISSPERDIFKITGEESLREVHKYRRKVDTILVGSGTVRTDNPRLTVRHVQCENQPLKMIIDPEKKIEPDSKIFQSGPGVIMITTPENKKREKQYGKTEFWEFKGKNGLIPINGILEKAGEENITSILVEGGSRTFTEFIRNNAVDEYLFFYSPSIIGEGVPILSAPIDRKYFEIDIEKIGNDFLIKARDVHGNN